ncbi:unnamed protein product [Peronospora farinosa]|uniref:PDZ domain-containing protein n=1 Tax=Peronospora farinosa TaxID=134698 RepID=A0AAV0STX5_9STRA|nr:unnamed protein product [Peronospora farinosa]CAI5708051.1 unnamed protein product [Peronospora farinosa]
MWGGYTAPGFTLKRKRTGAIFVTTVTQETETTTTLKLGSELKLVGGFPVNRLTLKDLKQVMLMAPKPVSLVFLNTDDVIIKNVNELSIEKKLLKSKDDRSVTTRPPSCQDNGEKSDSTKSFITTSTVYSETSETNQSKKRKISKLQVALVRVNQLLNRPVRQAGLHIAVGKSIVV